jgi:hypothetical protein
VFRRGLDPDDHQRQTSLSDQLSDVPWRVVGLAEPRLTPAFLAEAHTESEQRLHEEPSPPKLTRLGLGYGRWHDRSGQLAKVVTEPAGETPRSLSADLLNEVVNDRSESSSAAHREWMAAAPGDDQWVSPGDSPTSLVLDAVEFPARVVRRGSWWAARTIRGEVVITAVGKNLDIEDLRMISVDDMQPYIEARATYLEEVRQGHP